MLRPSSLSRALAGVAAAALVAGLALVGASGAPAYAAGARPRDPSQPLVLRMQSITPNYIPAKGPIVITGTATNVSDQEWTAINVMAFIGSSPITTTAGLAAAAKTPVSAVVGNRIATPGTFDTIDSLQPGETKSFIVTVPSRKLHVTEPGVYWFGVHALGATAEGRSESANGRDRTFLPYVPPAKADGGPPERASLVLPVRAGVTRDADGSVEDPASWLSTLRRGPLHDAVASGESALGRPLTWVIDPAVLGAVRQLAQGNTPRSLGPAPSGPSSGPSPSSPTTTSAAGSGSARSVADRAVDPAAVRTAARDWLRRLHQLIGETDTQVLGLPYGDLEIESVVRYDRLFLAGAVHRTGDHVSPWRVPLTPAVVPPSGRMSGQAVGDLPNSTMVLLDDTGVRGATDTQATINGHRVVLSSAGAAEGGPGPVNPLSPLALRQRVLSEAALRFLGDQQPLVVQLPVGAHALPSSFFSGLDVPWLRLSTLDTATAGTGTLMSGARLQAPPLTENGFGPEFYPEADRTVDEGSILQSLLPDNHVLRRQIFEETAANASYTAAADPAAALGRVRSTSAWVTGNLAGVGLAVPEKVTLASDNGHFSALVSNDLDVPVTVRVRALTDDKISITGPDKVALAPHGRTSVLLRASTHVLGVHSVTLELTTVTGRPIGASETFPLRAEAVSRLIWVIIGAGVILLFAAIVVRLVRRVMRARAS